MSTTDPLVSIVTPVYNNASHLKECIESVLAQTYTNWDYTIVDNCSSDGSAEIAHRLAEKDPRIRVRENKRFLRALENHNVALRYISPASTYTKVVFGSANSVLYRADLVRGRDLFYNEAHMNADDEVCFELLKDCDFGFVHQVLTFTRVRPGSMSAMSGNMQTSFPGFLNILLTYG